MNSNNTKYVKDTVNSLISTVVNWDYLAADRSTVWKASACSPARKPAIGAEVQLLRPDSQRVAQPEIYALIDMRIAREFRRSHSLALLGKHGALRGIGITAKIPLPKFRDLILGKDKASQSYKEYKLFKSKVAVPCIQEVNEVSDHTLELIEHKSGRAWRRFSSR